MMYVLTLFAIKREGAHRCSRCSVGIYGIEAACEVV